MMFYYHSLNFSIGRCFKLVKLLLIMMLGLTLWSCSHFKLIKPSDELKAENLEPRVSFIDVQSVEVEPSNIVSVDPDIVIKSYERLLNRGDPET